MVDLSMQLNQGLVINWFIGHNLTTSYIICKNTTEYFAGFFGEFKDSQ